MDSSARFRDPPSRKRHRTRSVSSDKSDYRINPRRSDRSPSSEFSGSYRESPERQLDTKKIPICPNDVVLLYTTKQTSHTVLPKRIKKGSKDDPVLTVRSKVFATDELEDPDFTPQQKKNFDCFREFASIMFKDLKKTDDDFSWKDPIGYDKRVYECNELKEKKGPCLQICAPLRQLYKGLTNEEGFTNGVGKAALEAILRIPRLILYSEMDMAYSGVRITGAPILEDNFGIRAFDITLEWDGLSEEEKIQLIEDTANTQEGEHSHGYIPDICMFLETSTKEAKDIPFIFGEARSGDPDIDEMKKQTWIQSLRGLRDSNETCGVGGTRAYVFLVLSAIQDNDVLNSSFYKFEFGEEHATGGTKSLDFGVESLVKLIFKLARVVNQKISKEKNLCDRSRPY